MRGDSARRSVQPLILLHTILREKVPLSYVFFWQMIRYPFLITNLEFCLPFNQCKGTAFEIWIYHKTRTFSRLFHSFRINLLALLGLFTYRNNPITLHFHILQPVKSPPFHIPEAWKRFPFQAEPPRIGHCTEYPTPPHPRGVNSEVIGRYRLVMGGQSILNYLLPTKVKPWRVKQTTGCYVLTYSGELHIRSTVVHTIPGNTKNNPL